jgi:hypothetical protein
MNEEQRREQLREALRDVNPELLEMYYAGSKLLLDFEDSNPEAEAAVTDVLHSTRNHREGFAGLLAIFWLVGLVTRQDEINKNLDELIGLLKQIRKLPVVKTKKKGRPPDETLTEATKAFVDGLGKKEIYEKFYMPSERELTATDKREGLEQVIRSIRDRLRRSDSPSGNGSKPGK